MTEVGRVVIGRLGRPHGVRGEIAAHATGPTLAEVPLGETVAVEVAGTERQITLTGRRDSNGALLLTFAGIDTREAAAALVNGLIRVDEARLIPLDDPEEFYVRDLQGCSVLAGDMVLGEVVDVTEGAANDAFVVRLANGEQMLIPFTRDAVRELDVAGRRIVVRADLVGGGDA